MWWESVLLYVCLMATVKYRLEKPSGFGGLKRKEVAIYCRVTVDRNNRFEFSTKLRVPPTYWNPDLQEVKAHFNGSKVINVALSKLKTDLLEMWNASKGIELSVLREKSIQLLKFGSNLESGPKKKIRNHLELFILDFIAKCEQGKVERSANTVQTYRATLDHLKTFSKESGYDLSFEAVTMDFCYDFQQYSWDTLLHEDSTLDKSLKILKMFMRESLAHKLHTNTSYTRFKRMDGIADGIYLTEEEITRIYKADLKDKVRPDLIRSRDLAI